MSVWLLRSVVRFLLRAVNNIYIYTFFWTIQPTTLMTALKIKDHKCVGNERTDSCNKWVGTHLFHEAGDFGNISKVWTSSKSSLAKPPSHTLELAVHHHPMPCGSVYHRFHTRLQLPLKGSKRWTPARYVNLYHLGEFCGISRWYWYHRSP